MNEKPLISVIVPVYNVEKYLRKCIESIINQTYNNLQIILVNDGSTDSSLSICKEYETTDNRIIVIDKENEGPAIARNVGLDSADGDFIAFVDSDDWILENMYEVLLEKQAIHNADMTVCGKLNYYEKTDSFVSGNLFENDVYCEKEEAIGILMLKSVAPWNKLYRKKLFDSIRFPEGKFIGEDANVIMRVIKECNGIEIISAELYMYNVRANSLMTSAFKPREFFMIEDNVDHYLDMKENFPAVVDVGEYNIFLSSVMLMTKISKLSWKQIFENKKYINECKSALKKVINHLKSNKYVYKKLRIAVLIIYYTPYLYIVERKLHGFKK